jgi:hypothetical protein
MAPDDVELGQLNCVVTMLAPLRQCPAVAKPVLVETNQPEQTYVLVSTRTSKRALASLLPMVRSSVLPQMDAGCTQSPRPTLRAWMRRLGAGALGAATKRTRTALPLK